MTETASRLSDLVHGLAQTSNSFAESREPTPAVSGGARLAAISAGAALVPLFRTGPDPCSPNRLHVISHQQWASLKHQSCCTCPNL